MKNNNRIKGGEFFRGHFSISPLSIGIIAFWGVLLTLALTVACDRGGTEQARFGHALPPEPVPQGFPASWEATRVGTTIQSVESEGSCLLIGIKIPQNTASGRQRGAFNLTLPEQTSVQSRVLRYAIGDRVLWDLTADDAATTEPLATGGIRAADIIAKGCLRQYPIYRLTIMDTLLKPFRDLPNTDRGDVSVLMELSWTATAMASETVVAPPGGTVASDLPLRGMRAVARDLVVNPGDLERFASGNPGGIHEVAPQPSDPRKMAPGGRVWAKVKVNRDGLYRLDADSLGEVGVLDSGLSLDTLRVFCEGRPIGLLRPSGQALVAGNGGSADTSAYFYGWGGKGPYSDERIYWVTADAEAPQTAMAPVDPVLIDREPMPLEKILRRFRMENNAHMLVEHGNFLSFKGAFWVDRKIVEAQPVMMPIRLFKPQPWTSGQTLPMRLKFYVYDNPQKWTGTELTLSVGSTPITTLSFDSPDAELLRSVVLPCELLNNDRFNLRLDVKKTSFSTTDAEDNAGIWLDWVEIDYPGQAVLEDGVLALDADAVTSRGLFRLEGLASQTDSPNVRLASLAVNHRDRQVRLMEPIGQASLGLCDQVWTSEAVDLSSVKVAALDPVVWDDSALDWTSPADYLIITHAAFRDGLAPLIELNASRNLKTRVVNVGDLYNFFSDGILSPQAIRNYLAYTASEAGPLAPDYVLLVGDCTSDYLDETRSGVVNWVPTYSYRSGEDTFASDVWFTTAVGTDALSDYLLGRFSVNNPDDLSVEIQKTVQYATKPVYGPWRARMASVADNFEQFRRTAELIENKDTPPAFDTRQVFLDRMALEDNWYYPQDELERIWAEERTMMKVSSEATLSIKDTFDAGVAWFDYYGHGAPNLWTDERIWFGGDSPNRDAQHLQPNGLYAFICNFTCNTGAIDYPMPQWDICISEDLMRVKDAGAVGMFVPSGPGQTILHEKLASHLRGALFKDGLRGFSELTTLARMRYLLDDNSDVLGWMYNLLGDPASQVALPRRWGALTLDREIAMPGRDTVTASMDGIWPPSGQASAWMEDDSGKVVWEKDDLICRDGRVRFECHLPDDFQTPNQARLFLYVWNEQAARDFVAMAMVKAARPEVLIRQARVTRLPGDEGLVHFELDLENTGLVDADSLKLRLTRLSDSDQPLDERSLNLSAGQTHTEALDLKLGDLPELELFDWAMSLPITPDSTQVANPQHTSFALPGESKWTGIVPALSYWEPTRNQVPNGRIHVACLSSDTSTSGGRQYLLWRTASGDVASSVSVAWQPVGEALEAAIDFTPQDFRQFQAQDNVLELVGMDPEGTTHTLEQIRLGEIAVQEPRLRIRPGTISHEPEYPTDGQTIYVTFIVENIGLSASAPTTALLQSDGSDNGQGTALPVQTNLQDNRVPGLAPGRSISVRLRWDPVKNAGVQNICVNLNPQLNRPEDIIKEQLIVHRIYVKTKSNLVRTRPPWSSASEEDRLADRIWLHVELENKGETDAHDVLVSFYLDKSRTDEKLIGRVEVDKIPAKSRREVKLMWAYDREKVLRNGNFNVRPIVDIRLKGSAQRIAE